MRLLETIRSLASPGTGKKNELAIPSWSTQLEAMNADFLYDFYRLPANKTILGEFVDTVTLPDDYIDICSKFAPACSEILPLFDEQPYSQIHVHRATLDSFHEFLTNPLAPSTLLIHQHLRQLYATLPDTRLPSDYNPHHNFHWRGISYDDNDYQKSFFIRAHHYGPGLPHPVTKKVYKPFLTGWPLPWVPEFIEHVQEAKSHDYVSITTKFSLLYWHNINIKSQDRHRQTMSDWHTSAYKQPLQYQAAMQHCASRIINVHNHTRLPLPD